MIIVDSRTIWQGKWDVRIDTIALPDGTTIERETVVHPGSVVLIPIIGDEVVMIRQIRPTIPDGDPLLELPAGTCDPAESPNICAQRELREETGYRAEMLIKLSNLLPSPGSSTELMHFYLATGLTHDPLPMDADETIENATIPFAAALEMAVTGQLRDMKSVAGLVIANQYIHSQGDRT